MRQQTPVSRVTPFSFNSQGDHPAGLWLTYALRKHCFNLSLPVISPDGPVFYALEQSFLSALGEPIVRFPIEWREQLLAGQVNYARQASQTHLLDAHPVVVECLDTVRFYEHLQYDFAHDESPDIPLPDQTQPLALVWEWRHTMTDVNLEGPLQRWCISGELPGAMAAYGILQSHCSDLLTLYYCYRPGTQTTAFTADIWAEDAAEAVKSLLQESDFAAALAQSPCLDARWLQKNIKKSVPMWPEISLQGNTIKIVSQKPDLRPASLKIEGYCWGLMAHLFNYLNTRYSSCDAVFQRLQHFDQKMRSALSPFA